MSVLAEFSIVPIGTGASVGQQVARVLNMVAKSGISYKANSMGTVLEGEWDLVMELIKKCHAEVMKDTDRVITSIKIDDCKGQDGRLEKKLKSVEQRLGIRLNK